MAQQAAKGHARRPRRTVVRSFTRRRPRNGSPRARSRKSRDVTELEQVIRRLENRVAQLTSSKNIHSAVSSATGEVGSMVTHATNHVGEMVADTLTDVAQKIRGGTQSVTSAARLGTGAIQRIGNELERRPLMTVAIALGIGFLAGLAGRRE